MTVTTALLSAACAVQVAAWPTVGQRDYVNYTSIFLPGLSPGASIHYPSDTDFKNTTVQRYSDWEEPTYCVTLKPATDQDVQLIVQRANENNFTFLATGGGHGAEPGFDNINHAVNIDLSNFVQNVLDVEANTLTIGPGIPFIEFEPNLYDAGKLMPVGNIFCVNMIGATIGATVGPFQGLVGLAIDYLQSVRMITPMGDLVTASKTENPDLFWAVRGAGANFGIITNAVFKVTDAPNDGDLVSADFAYPGAVNESMFDLIQEMDEWYPKEMGFNCFGGYNHTINETYVTVAMSYFGTRAEAQPILDRFLALTPTRYEIRDKLPWSKLSETQAFGMSGTVGCAEGIWNNHYTINANQNDAATYKDVFTDFATFAKGRPWFDGLFVVQRFQPDVTLAVPEEDRGCYPWRDTNTILILDNYYDGAQHDEEVYAYSEPVRDKLVAASGFGELRTYINYAFGDEGPHSWYGQNLERLVELKQQYDPGNKFGPGNPVPLQL